MAEMAAFLMWEGAGKSGKPSARLMALQRWARWESCWIGEGVDDFANDDNFSSIFFNLLGLILVLLGAIFPTQTLSMLWVLV